ncbi:hypothetical protein FN846DRAFT_920708 [Sphaerosporella brunnea]|uniref:Uncharacterized protein n=1 Tax=Sphaerosporella brunnea TaxID=1250544 RepID=A0A5J5ERI8_9PEZI|nr:hypothetical protein FN846DRAFT_920708 [Sphaerosporella brunnea]
MESTTHQMNSLALTALSLFYQKASSFKGVRRVVLALTDRYPSMAVEELKALIQEAVGPIVGKEDVKSFKKICTKIGADQETLVLRADSQVYRFMANLPTLLRWATAV